jgi:hypothetical protein
MVITPCVFILTLAASPFIGILLVTIWPFLKRFARYTNRAATSLCIKKGISLRVPRYGFRVAMIAVCILLGVTLFRITSFSMDCHPKDVPCDCVAVVQK